MLRDHLETYYLPKPDDLSVVPDFEVNLILAFIDRNISQFHSYYLLIRDSERENRISDFLIDHFQMCLCEEKIDYPFSFRKGPTQEYSGKETDIGVKVLTRGSKPVYIIEFEAKRFSETSKYKEYVSGERGGIERFKRGEHASHLQVCGMFGYVQSRTPGEWIQKVNSWIKELSLTKTSDIDWSRAEEQLKPLETYTNVEKLVSTNKRVQPNKVDSIILYHYFIRLF
jgi:hypothetical protein